MEECKTCEELEQGDRLYVFGEDDVGITFNKIGNIQYCPVCGKKLLSFKEKLRHKKKDYELMENSKLKMDTNEQKSKMMVCPFCGEKRICQLRFGQIADKRIPYYICLDCESMKV